VGPVISPIWERFLSEYPEVHLELYVESSPVDIVASGFDAGLSVRERVPADMIAVRVTGPIQIAFVASPGYLSKRPAPRTPDDLAFHQCVLFRVAPDRDVLRWAFERNGTRKLISVRGNVTVNDCETSQRAAVDGLGIAITLDAVAEPFLSNGQLVRVLEDWSPMVDGVYLYYQGRRQLPAALRAFIDMIRAPKSTSGRRPIKNPFYKA
jgi:DNA-binding transcriptional LysR family regulator